MAGTEQQLKHLWTVDVTTTKNPVAPLVGKELRKSLPDHSNNPSHIDVTTQETYTAISQLGERLKLDRDRLLHLFVGYSRYSWAGKHCWSISFIGIIFCCCLEKPKANSTWHHRPWQVEKGTHNKGSSSKHDLFQGGMVIELLFYDYILGLYFSHILLCASPCNWSRFLVPRLFHPGCHDISKWIQVESPCAILLVGMVFSNVAYLLLASCTTLGWSFDLKSLGGEQDAEIFMTSVGLASCGDSEKSMGEEEKCNVFDWN